MLFRFASHGLRGMERHCPKTHGCAEWARGPEPIAPIAGHLMSTISRARIPTLDTSVSLGLIRRSLPHNIFSQHSLNGVQLAVMRPGSMADCAAFGATRVLHQTSNVFKGLGRNGEQWWLRRLIFLSTMSSAPGSAIVGNVTVRADRNSIRDRWFAGLVKDSHRDKNRSVLLLRLLAPGKSTKCSIACAEAIFAHGFRVANVISPNFCRWLGGYIEEEQVTAYSQLLREIDDGHLPKFSTGKAPTSVSNHYGLEDGADLRQVFQCMLAETMHSR